MINWNRIYIEFINEYKRDEEENNGGEDEESIELQNYIKERLSYI